MAERAAASFWQWLLHWRQPRSEPCPCDSPAPALAFAGGGGGDSGAVGAGRAGHFEDGVDGSTEPISISCIICVKRVPRCFRCGKALAVPVEAPLRVATAAWLATVTRSVTAAGLAAGLASRGALLTSVSCLRRSSTISWHSFGGEPEVRPGKGPRRRSARRCTSVFFYSLLSLSAVRELSS